MPGNEYGSGKRSIDTKNTIHTLSILIYIYVSQYSLRKYQLVASHDGQILRSTPCPLS
jgi:hypothetical protein